MANEIVYALRQDSGRLRLLPLYLTSGDAPAQLSEFLAVDLMGHVYQAGLTQLLDVLKGKMPTGQTPLGDFERSVSSLPVISQESQESLDNLKLEYSVRKSNYGLYPNVSENEKVLQRKLDRCDELLRENISLPKTGGEYYRRRPLTRYHQPFKTMN